MRKLTEQEVREWLKEYRPDIELIKYGGNANTKSKFRCKKDGYEWENTLCHIKQGEGCPKCAKQVPTTVDDIRKALCDRNIELVSYCGTVNGKSVFKCTSCGRVWSTCWYNVRKGSGCPTCEHKLGGLRNRKMSISELVCEAKKHNINVLRWEGILHTKCVCMCKKCGYKWKPFVYVLLRWGGCPKCTGHKRVTKNEVIDWLKCNRPTISLVRWGGNTQKKSRFCCDVCGYRWNATFSHIKRPSSGCPRCNGNELVTKRKAELWLKEHKPHIKLANYSGTVMGLSVFHCKKCKYEWTSTLNRVKDIGRNGCPACGKQIGYKKHRIGEENARQWLSLNRSDIELLYYAGLVKDKSKFRCKKCGYEWYSSFSNIKSGCGCPHCVKKYMYDGFYFDSSLEIAFYMYKKFHDKVRLIRNYVDERFLCYGRDGVNRWYYDFYTKNGRKYEVKPENDLYVDCYGLSKEQRAILREQHTESLMTRDKKYANEKYGYGVIFVGYKEINPMKKWLLAHNYNWELYRIEKTEKQKD